MRILLSAFGFSPYRGSEAAVGWNIACELAKLHDVTVITGAVRECENDWARYLAEHGPVAGLTVEYVRPTRFIRFLDALHRIPCCWGFYYWAYNRWQKAAYRRAKRLHAEKPFDIVHHLNMIGYREPGYLWKLDAPFVWGPVGGAPNEPISYHALYSWSGCVKVFLRTVCNEIQKRICWRARKAARVARKIWAVTDADYRMIYDLWGVECGRMVEAGADAMQLSAGHIREWDGTGVFRIVWSGIHTSRKALPILLLALAKLGDVRRMIHVDVLGAGPETAGWKRLAERIGVSEALTWHGKLPRDEALEVMRQAHVLACPSIKEASSIVVIESLAMGLPVICHDACGMGIVVTAQCGVKIPLHTPEESVGGFAKAIENFLMRRIDLKTLSEGALARAAELTWAAKAQVMSAAYKASTPTPPPIIQFGILSASVI